MAGAVTTMSAWANAIVDALKTEYGSEFPLIGAYSLRDTSGTTYPQLTGQHALLLRAGNASLPEERRVLDRQGVEVDWIISVAVPTDTADADLVLLDRAARIAAFVRASHRDRMERGNRWGLESAVGDASNQQMPEFDTIDLHGYVLRPVTWTQVGYIAR